MHSIVFLSAFSCGSSCDEWSDVRERQHSTEQNTLLLLLLLLLVMVMRCCRVRVDAALALGRASAVCRGDRPLRELMTYTRYAQHTRGVGGLP